MDNAKGYKISEDDRSTAQGNPLAVELDPPHEPWSDTIEVPLQDLEKLKREVIQLKAFLPRILTSDLIHSYTTLDQTQEECGRLGAELEQMAAERDHWQSRCQAALAELEAEKAEKLQLRCELQEAVEQLGDQSEYCASMGAATCTLLWRVSRCEDSTHAILAGSKVNEFLGLVGSTLESYMNTYKQDIPNDNSQETQFILALCGIFTNIAASAFGRDFLMTHKEGIQLVDTVFNVLTEAPTKRCSKLKNLLLMSLYNLSINQKGLKHISNITGVVASLLWLLQEETVSENRLHCLRLLQSLLYEQTSPKVIHEAKEVLTCEYLQQLTMDPCKDVRDTALELLADIRLLFSEP